MRRYPGLLVLLAVLAAGCGNEEPEVRYLNSPGVLRQSLLERYDRRSPERALGEWARALVYFDVDKAASYYAPRLDVDARELARRRAKMQELFFDVLAEPRLTPLARTADTATVRGSVIRRTEDGDQKFSHVFKLERMDGEWKLVNGVLPKL